MSCRVEPPVAPEVSELTDTPVIAITLPVPETRQTRAQRLMAAIVAKIAPDGPLDQIDCTEPVTISKVSLATGVSLRTIRFYEECGLIKPARTGIRRVYARHDLDRLKLILRLRDFDLPMDEIKTALRAIDRPGDDAPGIERLAVTLRGQAEANTVQRERLARHNKEIADLISRLQSLQSG